MTRDGEERERNSYNIDARLEARIEVKNTTKVKYLSY